MSDHLASAWEALEEGLPEEALSLLKDLPKSPQRAAAEALARLMLGEYEEADKAIEHAQSGEPGDPDVLFATGEVHLAAWRIDGALEAFRALSEVAASRAGLERLALCYDLKDRAAEAERVLREAHALEPEVGGAAPRLTSDEFESLVQTATAALPDEFRSALDHVAVMIDPVPGIGAVVGDGRDTPPDLLGLFVGATVVEGAGEVSGELPPTVFLFQRNLERMVGSTEELVQEIHITLYHELGHALGFGEEGVEDMGLG